MRERPRPPISRRRPKPASGWEFEVAPYGWLAGLNGEAAQFGLPEQDVDVTIRQVIDNLDIALMGLVQVRNERFSAFSDLVYGKLTAEVDTPHGILADKIEITSTTLMWTVGAAYSIYYDPDVANFDLVVGGRLWSLDTDVKIKGLNPNPRHPDEFQRRPDLGRSPGRRQGPRFLESRNSS